MRRILVLGWLGVVCVAPAVAAAQANAETEHAAAEAEYRSLVEDAVRLSREGQLREALALFIRAHDVRPSARTLRGIGLVRFALSDYAGAIQALSASLEDPRRPLEPADRDEARSILEQAFRFVARVELVLTPDDATVWADARPIALDRDRVVLLNPGRHELRFEREGHAPETRSVSVEGGETHRLVVELGASAPEPPSEPSPLRVRVRSTPPGLVLHAHPMRTRDEPVPDAVSELCVAPCASQLRAGLYRFSIGRRAQPAVAVSTYRVEQALDLMLHLEDRELLRMGGWISIGVGVIGAVALFASIAALETNETQAIAAIAASGTLVIGLSLGIPLAALSDATALELRPLGRGPS